jgi:hypothetical protein
MQVTFNAEGVSWSPDVAADMVSRTIDAFKQAWDIAGDFAIDDDGEESTSTDGTAEDVTDS